MSRPMFFYTNIIKEFYLPGNNLLENDNLNKTTDINRLLNFYAQIFAVFAALYDMDDEGEFNYNFLIERIELLQNGIPHLLRVLHAKNEEKEYLLKLGIKDESDETDNWFEEYKTRYPSNNLCDLLVRKNTIDETIDNHEVDKPTKNEIDNRAFVQVKCADDLIELLNEFKEQMQSSNFSRNNRMSLFNCLVDEFAREFWVLHIRSKEIYPEYFIEPERDHLKRYN